MLKMVFLVKRADEVSHEELATHWLENHAPGVRDHMKPDHYSVTIFKQRAETPFDGMALLWWEDHDLGPVTFTNAPAPVANDGFLPLTGDFVRMDSTEHVIVDGPRSEGAIKMVYPVSVKPGVEHDEARAYWLDVHAPLVAKAMEQTDGALRYVVTHQNDFGRGRYAGIAEFWYENVEAIRNHGAVLEPDDFANYAVTNKPLMGTEHLWIP